MQQRTRRLLLALVATAALAAPERPALTADAPSPPGLDGFSERLLKGLRLRVGTRAAATAPDGTLHVVYGESQLRHAWNAGSGWQTETLDTTHGRGIGAALAFDAAGDLHVAYGDALRGELFHGEKSGAQWTSRLVAQGLKTPDPEPAIAVSSDGVVHVAWLDDYEKIVRYAQDASGSFAATTLATDSGYGSDLDLALAADGAPHVVFMLSAVSTSGSGPRALVHMQRISSGWTREDVESANDFGAPGVGAAASCAFAQDGELHAFYLGSVATWETPRPLRHARRTAGGWQTETVGTFTSQVVHTHAVADSAGIFHVGIAGYSTGWLAEGAWGDWSVASSPAVPPSPAFALTTDALHFAFADGSAIAVQRRDRTTLETSKTTLDRASEPLQRPSIATDASGRARIAIVREDIAGARVEVLRSDGAAWQLEVAASGALTSVAPSLRVAPDASLSVAYARPGGTLSCASDASGTWTSVDAVTDLVLPVNALAHAVAPDGTRRIAWIETGGKAVRVATEGTGGWTVSNAADLGWAIWQSWQRAPIDVEVTRDGVTHVVWLGGGDILRSYETGGSWTTETVGFSDNSWGTVPALDLVQSPQDDLWIAFSVPWQFGNFANAVTNRDGAWSSVVLGTGDVAALGFLSDGSARGLGDYWGVTRFSEDGMYGRQDSIDLGPGTIRRFGSAPETALTEGSEPMRLAVVPAREQYGVRVSSVAGAVDAAGACHAAYLDYWTGDLRYVTDRDPGRPATASIEIVRGPGSAGDADASFSPSVVRFAGDDDSGTKFVTVSIAQDDLYEPEEKLVLDLVNPAGVALGAGARVTVRLIDDETTPPPPPPPPPPGQSPHYFLPTKARIAADSSVRARGVLHLAGALPDPLTPFVVAWGDREITVPWMRWHPNGLLTWSDGGARFSLQRERGSAARYRFDLRLPPGDPSPAGPFVVRLDLDGVDPASSVNFVRGKLDLERGEGWFDDPPLHLESLRATDGAPGSLALSALLQGLGGVIETPPHVWINVGTVFAREIEPSEFRREDAQWVAASRDVRVTVDHGRGRVSARFDDANVFLPPEGVSTLGVQVRVQFGKRDVVRSLSTPVTRKGRKLRI